MATPQQTKKQESKDKKKKKWVQIIASSEFNNAEVGETYVEDPANSVGRTVEMNLMVLTNDPKRQSHNVKFKITEFKNNVLHTEVIGLSLQTAQLKRTTKKDKRKLEDSFICVTKDNVSLRFKPIILTKAYTTKPKLTAIRKLTREIVTKYAKDATFNQLVKDTISGQIQRVIKNDAKKLYPLASCIIKKLERM